MKSTGKSPVSTNKSPMAVYINDVSPGPADCNRLDRSENSPNSKKLEASIMEVHCYKALHPYPFKHDDICSCMLHRGFTIAVSHEFEFTIYFHVLYNLTSLIYLKVILFSGDTN
ncbi:hypothetical protein YC2023_067268 [Brassica napus]